MGDRGPARVTDVEGGREVRGGGKDDPVPGGTWTVYDGRRETVSDGPPPAAAPHRRWERWLWPGVVAAAAAVAVVVAWPPPAQTTVLPEPDGAVAPARWAPVSAALSRGLVVVHGGAEADGIVLPGGLVATSYSRLQGERRPPADGVPLRVVADGHGGVTAQLVGTDSGDDIAILSAPGFAPATFPGLDAAVRAGETLTLLDDQGGKSPVLGIGVTVTNTGASCHRAGSAARPTGFRFSLHVASAEPGAALVRADGTVVGMYVGGDDAASHCAVPIAAVLAAADAGR